MQNTARRRPKFVVSADGTGIVSHAGGVLLMQVLRATGLDAGLSSGLAVIASLLDSANKAGIPAERTVIVGFSQGACLSLEFVARYARRYGGVIALSGGLIGPDGTPRDYPGSLAGTPVFLGCSDIDPHVPKERVLHSAEVLRMLGGQVTAKLYPRMGHTINRDEIIMARGIVEGVIG